MRNQANSGRCCRPSSAMRFGLRIRHFHMLRAAEGNNAYRSRNSIRFAVSKRRKTQVTGQESAVRSGRDAHRDKSGNETRTSFRCRRCRTYEKGANKRSTDSNAIVSRPLHGYDPREGRIESKSGDDRLPSAIKLASK
jgi:hypothetical protein